jgi:hypothetical protein
MPKETIERVELVVTATLPQMGFVIAALTRLGVGQITHRLITDELTYKGRRVHEVAAAEFVAAFVRQNARFKTTDLAAHFKEAGRAATGAYPAIKKLLKDRVVAKNGNQYVRIEALPAPGKTAKAAKKSAKKVAKKSKRGRGRPYEVSNRALIERAMRGRKHIKSADLVELFASEKRPAKSVSPILTKMVQAKLLKSTGGGTYDVIGPKAAKPPAKKAAAVMMNGSGAEAHG